MKSLWKCIEKCDDPQKSKLSSKRATEDVSPRTTKRILRNLREQQTKGKTRRCSSYPEMHFLTETCYSSWGRFQNFVQLCTSEALLSLPNDFPWTKLEWEGSHTFFKRVHSDSDTCNSSSCPFITSTNVKVCNCRIESTTAKLIKLRQVRNAYNISVGKPEGKKPLGRPRGRWKQ